MYYAKDDNGIEINVSKDEVKKAVDEQRAVIMTTRADGDNPDHLIILDATDDAERYADVDTRDECRSVWDERWARWPKNCAEALDAAFRPE